MPPIFRLIQNAGQVSVDEMYDVFNMGIGLTVMASKEDASILLQEIPGSVEIGEVVRGDGPERVIIS